MSDDIVTRLREDFITNGQCDYCEQWEWRGHYPSCPYQSAADEIERLRKLTSELAQLMMPFAMLMTNEEQQTVLKAVRGE